MSEVMIRGTAVSGVSCSEGPLFGFPLDFARGFGKTGQAFSKSARRGGTPVNFGTVKKPVVHSLAKTGPPAEEVILL